MTGEQKPVECACDSLRANPEAPGHSAWVAMIAYAGQKTEDPARAIQGITNHYLWLRQENERLRKWSEIAMDLYEALPDEVEAARAAFREMCEGGNPMTENERLRAELHTEILARKAAEAIPDAMDGLQLEVAQLRAELATAQQEAGHLMAHAINVAGPCDSAYEALDGQAKRIAYLNDENLRVIRRHIDAENEALRYQERVADMEKFATEVRDSSVCSSYYLRERAAALLKEKP